MTRPRRVDLATTALTSLAFVLAGMSVAAPASAQERLDPFDEFEAPPVSQPARQPVGPQPRIGGDDGTFAPGEGPVSFIADTLRYDEAQGLVVATGNVEIEQSGRLLIADEVTYRQHEDIVTATGNVNLLEPTGEILFADYMELTGDLRDGVVHNIRLLLADRSRMAAAGARRFSGEMTDMRQAVYSPCDLCEEDPTRAPLWQVKAVRVVHDQVAKDIIYQDATLEIFGVPILYTPYLSHPDPTVDRRSGILTPTWGNSTELGFTFAQPYYLVLDDHSDATITPRFMSEDGGILEMEYRQRLTNGQLAVAGSAGYVSARDNRPGRELRGHIDAIGRFDIDDTWRWGFNAVRATDDTYLRRYDFDFVARTLDSQAFIEGFDGRDYASARTLAYQSLSTRRGQDLPVILPLLDYNVVNEPGAYGDYTTFDFNALGLHRAEGTQSQRLSLKAGWHLPFVSNLGEQYLVSATLRGDGYYAEDVVQPDGTLTSGFAGRLHPEARVEWRLPLVRNGETMSQLVEPIVSASVSPYGGNPDGIPNEDSRTLELDDTNLFGDRMPGLDRVEGGPRVSYGLRASLFTVAGGSATAFIGQSVRAKTDSEAFANGSGLEDNVSDVVGRIDLTPIPELDVMYRFRLDKDNFAPRVHSLSATAGPPSLRVTGSYTRIDSSGSQEFARREEAYAAVAARLTPDWRIRADRREDLTKGGGPLAWGVGLTYEDECLIFDASYRRSFFRDREVQPTDTVLFRVAFKTLGEFGISGL